MREKLKEIKGMRQRFTATFVRFGIKLGYKGRQETTLLFKNVCDKKGVEVCDHIWFTDNKQFLALGLKPEDKICFDARVKPYTKGYKGRREDVYARPVSIDYKLSHPNNIIKHTEGDQGKLF